ncbi:gp53-like domain-containing protein [Burkholderia vietnamiensis]|uniref:gp53-like domain-containing protein n=1 Tax=Burkholderia vietnamiensis TaxID=60552 RepID=UPI001ABA86A1|nr:hypothetical protein [Burkholderia vietnamiensis]MCA7945156.1 hypothetical protein [Burkholderia vietnamiensis]HDR8969923.1 hypothetical protein [Burkholderia vietnamiensis]HDR9143075.1 hypothetical protein [Burkholderia vietnamiensis]HDR9219322.1 hypothetical protein [Burkholderia vietnamiensis]
MTNLVETDRWEEGVYQLETSDPVVGGPDGIDNLQARQLANRTRYLKAAIEARQSDFDGHVAAVDPHPQYATHADLAEKVAALVAQSPEALDTLSELAKALGNDPDFATTITTELATRAPIDSPVFTGMPKTSTPAQFDSSDRLAPTGFVQRALGNMQIGTRIQSAANAILSASHAGGFYTLEVASTTYTLPSLASVKPGATFEFLATVNAATVATAGADKMMTGSLVSSSTCVLNNGDTAKYVSVGTYWVLVGGSAALRLSLGDFGSSLGSSGYQKSPNGQIVQWGNTTTAGGTGATLGPVTSNFPIAFPNGCVFAIGALANGGTSAGWAGISAWVSSYGQSQISVSACLPSGVTSSGVTVGWIAFGR